MQKVPEARNLYMNSA